MICKELEENLVNYIYDELTSEEREKYDAHVASCATCRSEVERVRRLHSLLDQRASREPSPELLAECRQALNDALDQDPPLASVTDWFRSWRSAFRPSPVFSAAGAMALIVFGFGLGWEVRSKGIPGQRGVPEITSSSIVGPDFHINGISRVSPGPQTGEVRVTLDAERRMTLEGSLDDPHIQQVLLYAVKSYDNPGIRRDTLDALRTRASSPNVRQALLYAMGHDRNLGVRLEALDSVRDLDWGPDARQAFLNLVEQDTNPGLRAAAIDELSKHLEPQVVTALTKLSAKDPNRFVRLKCASALREVEKP